MSSPVLARPSWRARLAARRADVGALVVIVVLVFCFFSPALKDGSTFAPADLGRGLSYLTNAAHPAPNHNDTNGDIIDQGLPWYITDWQAVHHGDLPLWSPLLANGMPQLLNFESGAFALPSLVGYLFPLSLAFLVTMAMKLLIAGIGTYLFCRLIRLRPIPACFAAVTFMLSGSVVGWLGWAISGVFCWAGFLAAGTVIAYRGKWRARDLAALAVPLAFAVYGGFPEGYVLMGLTLAAAGVAVVISMAVQRRAITLSGLFRLGAGGLIGLALSAPLWLAGLSIVSSSVRRGDFAAAGLPTNSLALVFTQGFDGLPTQYHPSPPGTVPIARYFGASDYYEAAAYVGALALVLALVGVVAAYRRPIVAGMAATALASALLVYKIGSIDPVQDLVRHVGLGAVDVNRVLAMLGFGVACLAGIGLEAVIDHFDVARVRRALLGALGLATIVDIAMFAETAGTIPLYRHDRLRSLIWPTGSIAVIGVIVLLACIRRDNALSARARQLLGPAFVALQGAFLLFAGVGISSFAQVAYPVTPAVATLQRVVGTSLVGIDTGDATCPAVLVSPYCGVKGWTGDGFYPNINIGFGIDQLGLHDPVISQATFATWPVPDAGQGLGGVNIFMPDIDTVALARDYGVSYVIVRPGQAAPAGMRKVATLVAPGSRSWLLAVPASDHYMFSSGPDTVTGAVQNDDSDATVTVRAPKTETLSLHISAYPGWHASADGRAIPITTGPENLLQVRVPAGTHTISLDYWPSRLTKGFIAAGIAVFALAGLAIGRRRRRFRRSPAEHAAPSALAP